MADDLDAVFQALRHAVHGDPALQAQLFGLTDTAEFVAAVRRLASASGHTLQDEDVLTAMRAGRKAWSDRKLP
ncbi:MAG: hypothetical protein CVV05_14690 [Gammaproteobacteria bacterium HGW-Gammaproteobacteria-1]|jgi:hypothetical protein|nr:MAG: hypothetical protein CVV05_14690 [Gammaproteobacteria bacterium HGW-Gammaproteobacteria-1]